MFQREIKNKIERKRQIARKDPFNNNVQSQEHKHISEWSANPGRFIKHILTSNNKIYDTSRLSNKIRIIIIKK
jgi:hypothetical protein